MTTSTLTPPTTGPETAAESSRPDLHERALGFARQARAFVTRTPRTIANLGDCRQLIRSSGSIGASYLEAGDADSRQGFILGMRTCRRTARQCTHWLELLDANLEERVEQQRQALLKEAHELERIFGAIVGSTLRKAKEKAAQTA